MAALNNCTLMSDVRTSITPREPVASYVALLGIRLQARARELVDAALGERDPSSIVRVRLSNKSYSAEAAAVVAAVLKNMTGVTEVSPCGSSFVRGSLEGGKCNGLESYYLK